METLETVAGVIVVLLVLGDIFLTILYARIETGPMMRFLARNTWRAFRRVARRSRRPHLLAYCGPTILIVAVLGWTSVLGIGSALIIHPHLGTSIISTNGHTPTDFMTALYAAGTSMAIVGIGDFSPQTSFFRCVYLVNSLIGLSFLSLVVTYLLQVYNALRQRNVLGLELRLLSGGTEDAADLVAGLGPEGRFESCGSIMASVASSMTEVKEAHHFYPVLFYFRFKEAHYSVAHSVLISLDTISLIKAALDDERYGWFKETASISQLWHSSMAIGQLLLRTFLTASAHDEIRAADKARWRRRYLSAVHRLQEAGIKTRADHETGFKIYAALRRDWDQMTRELAYSMEHAMEEIDPAGTKPESVEDRAEFRMRLHSIG